MPRMRILNTSEQARLEQPPVFDSAERKRHFGFPRMVLETARGLRGSASQVGFLLSYGYFRATRRFFRADTMEEAWAAYQSARLRAFACRLAFASSGIVTGRPRRP